MVTKKASPSISVLYLELQDLFKRKRSFAISGFKCWKLADKRTFLRVPPEVRIRTDVKIIWPRFSKSSRFLILIKNPKITI